MRRKTVILEGTGGEVEKYGGSIYPVDAFKQPHAALNLPAPQNVMT
jgi:hypothetical protein